MDKRKKLLYGEKFDIESFADLIVIMAVDEEIFNLLERAILNLLIQRKVDRMYILEFQNIMQKIKVDAMKNLIDEVDGENIDTALKIIDNEAEKMDIVFNRANIGLFDILLEISKNMFMFTSERWFIMQSDKMFVVLMAYVNCRKGETTEHEL